MTRSIPELIGSENEMYRSMGDNWKSVLRVSCPGIIQSFDPITQTCTIQPALREEITKEGYTKKWMNLPLLLDVPIVIPSAGGYALTLPIKKGDECLVIFSDSCIDAWFSYGGIQNQIEKRRHSLSDAICIPGLYSQPNVIPNYSATATELRSISGTSKISLSENQIKIDSPSIVLNGVSWNHTHTVVDVETSTQH